MVFEKYVRKLIGAYNLRDSYELRNVFLEVRLSLYYIPLVCPASLTPSATYSMGLFYATAAASHVQVGSKEEIVSCKDGDGAVAGGRSELMLWSDPFREIFFKLCKLWVSFKSLNAGAYRGILRPINTSVCS